MKRNATHSMRVIRAVKAGAGIGAMMLATSALRAQSTVPPPSTTAQNSPPAVTQPAGENSEKLSHRGKEFLKDAGQGNQLEISLADVADLNSQNSQVKDLAKELRNDHRKANDELRALAAAHGYTLDTTLDFLNQHTVDHLRDMDKAKFDREYAIEMLKTHVKAIKMFDKAGEKVDEADIKGFAQKTLPTLRMHLKRSEEVARTVGVEESKISSIVKGTEVTAADQTRENGSIAQH